MINCFYACTDTNMHAKAFVDYPLTSPPTPFLLWMLVTILSQKAWWGCILEQKNTLLGCVAKIILKLGINTAHSDHIWLCLKYQTRNMELQGQSYVGRMHYKKNKTRKHWHPIYLHPCLLKIVYNHLPLSPTDTFVVFYKRNSKTALWFSC